MVRDRGLGEELPEQRVLAAGRGAELRLLDPIIDDVGDLLEYSV